MNNQILKFLGTGSAFNTDRGSNSAFLLRDGHLVLIDCGESTFSSLRVLNMLNKEELKDISILITHLHSDHIGSLGTLIFYCHYQLNLTPSIYAGPGCFDELKEILKLSGVSSELYNIKICAKGHDSKIADLLVTSVITSHFDNIVSYGFIIKSDEFRVYFSGDTGKLPDIIVEEFNRGLFNQIYVDVSRHAKHAHINYKTLESIFDDEDTRNKVFCMHIDDEFIVSDLKIEGFNVVEKYHNSTTPLIDTINNLIGLFNDSQLNKGRISDGYHTFDELYEHRHILYLSLISAITCDSDPLHKVWYSDTHDDGTKWDGWIIVGIDFCDGKYVTYHLPSRFEYALKTMDIDKVEKARAWDGHTSDDVLKRLSREFLFIDMGE